MEAYSSLFTRAMSRHPWRPTLKHQPLYIYLHLNPTKTTNLIQLRDPRALIQCSGIFILSLRSKHKEVISYFTTTSMNYNHIRMVYKHIRMVLTLYHKALLVNFDHLFWISFCLLVSLNLVQLLRLDL